MTDSLYVKTSSGLTKVDVEATTSKTRITSTLSSALSAGTAFAVPTHTVGGDELLVWIEGLLCTRGVEYTDASATTITFTSDIPADFTVSAWVIS